MQALILAGGKGTRLRPLTVYTPKPIVPLGNRPFLLSQIEILRRAGITDIVMSLSYQPDKIELLLDQGFEYGVRLRYLTEPSPMGTAGAYKFAEDFLQETTIVFNGDILTDLELGAVLEYHKRRSSLATIVLTAIDNPAAYGVVVTDGEGRVKQFLEKPSAQVWREAGTNNINAGIYLLEPEVLAMIPAAEPFSFEYQLFPALLKENRNFFAFVRPGTYWKDIGTPQRYLEAHHDLLSGRIKNFTIEKRRGDAEISHTAEVDEKSLIADNCVIKPGARITNSVLGAGVYVEEKAVIENSVVWQHTRINTFAHVSNAVIGRGCHIGRFAVVGANSVLGDKTSLTDYTQV